MREGLFLAAGSTRYMTRDGHRCFIRRSELIDGREDHFGYVEKDVRGETGIVITNYIPCQWNQEGKVFAGDISNHDIVDEDQKPTIPQAYGWISSQGHVGVTFFEHRSPTYEPELTWTRAKWLDEPDNLK